MKMRRRTGVNGVRENHRDTVVNQGGTAEFIWSFGPLSEMAEDRMIFYFIGNFDEVSSAKK